VRRLRAGWSIDPLQIETGRQIQRQFQIFTVGHFGQCGIWFSKKYTSATRHWHNRDRTAVHRNVEKLNKNAPVYENTCSINGAGVEAKRQRTTEHSSEIMGHLMKKYFTFSPDSEREERFVSRMQISAPVNQFSAPVISGDNEPPFFTHPTLFPVQICMTFSPDSPPQKFQPKELKRVHCRCRP
jgi:hypothetical protein